MAGSSCQGTLVAPMNRIGRPAFLSKPSIALQDLRHDALHHARALVAPGGDERFDLVDEDDRRAPRRRGVEELLDVLLGLADPLAQHVGGRDAEERRVDLAGGRLGEHRLAGARRAVQQHPAAGPDAEPLGQLRVLERVDHLQADVFLDVVQPRDVVEPERRLLLHDPLARREAVSPSSISRCRPRDSLHRCAATPQVGAPLLLLRLSQSRASSSSRVADLRRAALQLLALGLLARAPTIARAASSRYMPRRIPLPRAARVEALLPIPLELSQVTAIFLCPQLELLKKRIYRRRHEAQRREKPVNFTVRPLRLCGE